MDRSGFDRVVAIANRKGGVGKTSIVANVAWNTAAADGRRVLIIDLDAQGHVSLEFGCRTHPELGYDPTGSWRTGDRLRAALTTGSPLVPVRDIRPNIDLVSADPTFYEDPPANRRLSPWDMLVGPLDAVADNYELIIIDTPPTSWPMTQMAFGVARYVVFPFKPEIGSIEGIPRTYDNILEAQEINPDLEILKFVMALSGSRSTRIHREALDVLHSLGVRPDQIADQIVPFLERAASYGRNRGLLPAEALAADTGGRPWFEYAKRGEPVPPGPGGKEVAQLVQAYGMLSADILNTIGQRESERDQAGTSDGGAS